MSQQRHTGEIVLADRWREELGHDLPTALPFRIVLLSRYQEVSPGVLHDARVALCMPSHEPAALSPRVPEERADYLVASDWPSLERSDVWRVLTATEATGALVRGQLGRVFRKLARSALNAGRSEARLGTPTYTLKPYLCLLLPSSASGKSPAWRAVQRRLEALSDELTRARRDLDTLAGILPASAPDPPQARLERLAGVCSQRTTGELEAAVRASYGSPAPMAEDLALLARIGQLGEHVDGLVRARAYLDAVSLPEGQEEMALDLSSLRHQLELDNVVQNPHLCPSLQALFAWFRSRYAKLYRERHLRYQREMTAVLRKIEQARPAVAALARLNALRELGPPVSAHLPAEFARLTSTLKCCPQETAQGLEEAPRCALCGLGPEEEAPVAHVERLSAELERALREQNRRLSAEAICQILAQSSEELVDRFIKIVQASDLSALANILDDRLAGFLRDLLVGAPTPPACPVLAELARLFPVVEEGEEEAVLAEFARLLEQAFVVARAEQPRPVRVALAAMAPEREKPRA